MRKPQRGFDFLATSASSDGHGRSEYFSRFPGHRSTEHTNGGGAGHRPLPEGWRWIRFQEVAVLGSGQVSPLDEPYRSYPHIGPENIESGTGRILGLRTAQDL